MTQVGTAVLPGRGTYCDEEHLNIIQAFRQIGGEDAACRLSHSAYKIFKTGLINRNNAVLEFVDLVFIGINTVYCCAKLGEAGAANQADIACSYNGNIHVISLKVESRKSKMIKEFYMPKRSPSFRLMKLSCQAAIEVRIIKDFPVNLSEETSRKRKMCVH